MFQRSKFLIKVVKDIFKNKRLIVVSAAPLIRNSDNYAAYTPYAKEMALWAKHCGEIDFCCPVWNHNRKLLNSDLNFDISEVYELNEFSIKSVISTIRSFKSVIVNFRIIIKAFKKADHIHLRCPGNIGLLGCIAQIFFPSKQKSAKYAGNWDPKSLQPLSYKLQKWILSNTFLTRNIQVLVYGEWPNQTKNIKPFFTATYTANDKNEVFINKFEEPFRMLFVGTLSAGKNPIYALQLIHHLINAGMNVLLEIYGEGSERYALENYIINHSLQNRVSLYGNQNEETVREAYQKSHFIILPSKSEGWPKVVAEAMFWGAVPIASAVSCIPFMLDYGRQGILLKMELEYDKKQISILLNDVILYRSMSSRGKEWSRQYTVDKFENEIKLILN